MKEIVLNILPGGKVEIKTSGFAGEECLQATEAIEKGLGVPQSKERTAEFYNNAEVRINSKTT